MTTFLLLTTLFGVIIFIIFQWIFKYIMLRQKLSTIPGPKTYPFIGMIFEVMKVKREDIFNWFNDILSQYDSGIVLTWFGTEAMVILQKPEHMEVILRSNTQITKSKVYDFMKPWLGNGLLTSTGELWHRHRRLITPTFNYGILEQYAVVMGEKAEIFKECIESKLKIDSKAPVKMLNLATKYSLDTICTAAMGVEKDMQRKPETKYVKAVGNFARLSIQRFYNPWGKWDALYFRTQEGKETLDTVKTLKSFTEKVLQQKQAERKVKMSSNTNVINEFDDCEKPKHKAFLDHLFEASENAKNPLSFQELREEVDTFMTGGHDTVLSAISWGLFALGNALEVQDKVREELQEVFGESEQPATFKQLGQLKYLERVIKEILRLYPSGPIISRITTEDVFIQSHYVPKGTYIEMNIYKMHRDPAIWDNPERFDPDRFFPENSYSRHPFSYIPFSAGPRNCMGQKFAMLELKTAFSMIFRKWRVTSVLKPNEIKLMCDFILRPQNGDIELYFTPIVKKNEVY